VPFSHSNKVHNRILTSMLVPIKLIFAKILAANHLQIIKFVKTLRFAAKVFAMPTS